MYVFISSLSTHHQGRNKNYINDSKRIRKNTNTQVWKEEERERVAAENGSAKRTDECQEAANQREMKLKSLDSYLQRNLGIGTISYLWRWRSSVEINRGGLDENLSK